MDQDWIVDIGAALPVVTGDAADQLIYRQDLAYSAGWLLGRPLSFTSDLAVTFECDCGCTVHHHGHVGIRHDDIEESLLGMSAISGEGASLTWSPGSGVGDLSCSSVMPFPAP